MPNCDSRGPMRSVPPRGSGWVMVVALELPGSLIRTHPLPRGGTDFMGPRGAYCASVTMSIFGALKTVSMWRARTGKTRPPIPVLSRRPVTMVSFPAIDPASTQLPGRLRLQQTTKSLRRKRCRSCDLPSPRPRALHLISPALPRQVILRQLVQQGAARVAHRVVYEANVGAPASLAAINRIQLILPPLRRP